MAAVRTVQGLARLADRHRSIASRTHLGEEGTMRRIHGGSRAVTAALAVAVAGCGSSSHTSSSTAPPSPPATTRTVSASSSALAANSTRADSVLNKIHATKGAHHAPHLTGFDERS